MTPETSPSPVATPIAPPITPGAYLEMRRKAAGLSIDDVAARISTEPQWAEVNRKGWLQLIEADAVPMGEHVIDALSDVFSFDLEILVRFDAIRMGSSWSAPEICRVCGCSEFDPCLDEAHLATCGWSETDRTICTTCARRPAASDEGEPA